MTSHELNSPGSLQKRIEENLLLGVMKEITDLKEQPRLQLFVTHGLLELVVNILIKERAKNGKKISSDTRSYPYSAQILILNELSIITDEEFKVLDWFRKMRNRAAHEALFKITDQDLKKIKIAGKKIQVDNFTYLCTSLILTLANGKFDVLGKHITPTLL